MRIEFHFLLFKTFHAQRNFIRKDMHEYNLSPGQPKVLRYVSKNKNCMLKDIATFCDVEPATISKILNSMEEKELLVRIVAKDNKRAMSISMTEKGNTALQQWEDHCKEVEDVSLKGFTLEEIDEFEDFLCRMYHNLTGKNIE